MTNKEAIEILQHYHNGYFGYKIDDVHEAHNLAIKALEDKPQGEWIQSETDRLYHTNNWKCSNCHSIYVIWNSPLDHDYKFCPNCGARMTGGKEK